MNVYLLFRRRDDALIGVFESITAIVVRFPRFRPYLKMDGEVFIVDDSVPQDAPDDVPSEYYAAWVEVQGVPEL